MKKKLVYGLMALSLWAPAQARPEWPVLPNSETTVAQESEVRFLLLCLGSPNEEAVIKMVKAQPALARRCFELTLKGQLQNKPAKRDKSLGSMLWIWARALNDGKLKQRLSAAQIADKPYAWVDATALPRTYAEALVALGSFRSSERVLTALEKKLKEKSGADIDRQRLFLAKARIVSGRYLLARQQSEELVTMAKTQAEPKELLEVYACLLDAGRMGGFPDLTNRYLEPFRQAIETLPPESRPYWQFFQGSFDQLHQMERNPETDPKEFCRRHDAVWQGLQTSSPFESPLMGRVFRHLSTLWLERMADFYQSGTIVEDSPEDQQMSRSLAIELTMLTRVAQASQGQQDSQPYAARMALFALLVDAHEQVLRVGQVKLASTVVPVMVSAEKDMVAEEPKLRVMEKFLAEFLRLINLDMGGAFSFNFIEGDWSSLRARMRQAQLNQLMAERQGALQPAQLKRAQKLASEALDLNQRALHGAGYQGSLDVRWAVVEYLFQIQPPGWQKSADRLISQLTEVNRQLGYREGMARTDMLRGRWQAAQGQAPAAVASLQQAINQVEAYLTEVEAGEAGSRAIRDRYKTAYQLLAKLQVKIGKTDGAFQTVSRQLEAQAAQQNQDSLRDNVQMREVQRVRTETAALERQVADERQQGKDPSASEQLLASNKGEYQRVVADLRRSHPQYEGAMAVRPVEFLELKRSIPTDTTAVLFFVSDDGVYSFVASQQGELKIHKVAVDPKELEKSVLRVRQLINLFPHDPALSQHPEGFRWNDPASPGYQRQSLPLKTELARLDKWLIEPILGDLGGRPVLAIVPTGVLHYVPFPALCSLDAAGNPKFLAETYQCVNLVKTSDLVPLAGVPPGKRLFAMGNPDGSLPGAEREVDSITANFPQSQKAVGKDATASRLKKLDPDTGYVHLATHGQLSEADPKNSYLVMAGSGESGHFRATDIYDLDWQGVRLVTLSACKTALQEGKPGAAITSLAEAFRVAGGHSVVASLWSVEDNATEQLMVEFYKQLAQGKSLAASLQNAEMSLSKQPKFGHPFFWAAFTLFGDWR